MPDTDFQAVEEKLTRRQFLKFLGLFLAGGLLASCAEAQEDLAVGPVQFTTPIPNQVLKSPGPPQTEQFPEGLARFMALSAAITGFEDLDPQIGTVYMQSVEDNPDLLSLEEIYQAAQITSAESAVSLEQLQSGPLFSEEASRQTVNEIAKMWYTGVYTENGEPMVATFVDSLAWKSLRFTKPNSICASFGFWATPPAAERDN